MRERKRYSRNKLHKLKGIFDINMEYIIYIIGIRIYYFFGTRKLLLRLRNFLTLTMEVIL